jgi:ketosteroid isomerase-like protein
MKWFGMGAVATAAVLSFSACGGSSSHSATAAELQKEADILAIDQIEQTWHRAASLHNVGMVMSLWAPDATFNIGTQTLTGRAEIRDFFEHQAAPFQAQNHWVSDTPSYRIRITVNGDKGTLYFECHYIDVKTQKVVSVVAADQNVQKIDGKWMITSAAGATPSLGP